MRVGIIDIGSNTARLLVAAQGASRIAAIHEERTVLALGDEVERFGRISDLKLAETADRARRYARRALRLRCAALEVIVTAPGRQAENGEQLVRLLARSTGAPVRLLSAAEEGRLAFAGAVAQAGPLPERVAVCDVGGGSTEIVVGRPLLEPGFCSSLDVGSLRLSRRFLDAAPPGKWKLAAARREVERRFEGLELPAATGALATGGSARSLRRLVGRTLGEDELALAIKRIRRHTAAELASGLGLDPIRARTLLAGALILAEAQRRLGVPLQVARGGLREGAAAALLAERVAA